MKLFVAKEKEMYWLSNTSLIMLLYPSLKVPWLVVGQLRIM